jgi:hypothetical protein
MRNPLSLLFPAVALVALAGCLGPFRGGSDADARVGIDTRPEGPAFGPVQAAADAATRVRPADPGRFDVTFVAGGAAASATFSFPGTDINDRLGVALDLTNRGANAARVYADLNADTWVRGYVTVPPGRTRTLYVFARRQKLSAADAEKFPGMHGIPGGKMSLWAGIEEPIVAASVRVFAVMPRADLAIQVANIRPFGSSKVPDNPAFFPFIDRYGQYAHKDWHGKILSDADFQERRRDEDRDLAAHPGPGDLDRYGGWEGGPALRASGHFRVEKVAGKWWLVDPEGRLFWSNGIDAVGFTRSVTAIAGRERFYEDAPPMGDFLARNLRLKYGDDWRRAATDRTFARLRSWGINTLGSWSDPSLNEGERVPYTLFVPSCQNRALIDPYSPEWADGMRQRLADAAARVKDDPWCLGYFVDNEIHVSRDPAWFERYYSQVSAAGKQAMPNTLYLGSRLDYHDWPDVPEFRREIVRSAARYCDVISFNFYKFTLEDVALPEGVDRPVIVGEFHMGALDRGLFHTGLRSVVDQRQRAEAYRYFVTSALENPAVVGAHWFQFYDEPTTGRSDGENYQIGFLDQCDTPYAETLSAARDTGYRLYAIRSGGN